MSKRKDATKGQGRIQRECRGHMSPPPLPLPILHLPQLPLLAAKTSKYSNRALTYPNRTVIYPDRICILNFKKLLNFIYICTLK